MLNGNGRTTVGEQEERDRKGGEAQQVHPPLEPEAFVCFVRSTPARGAPVRPPGALADGGAVFGSFLAIVALCMRINPLLGLQTKAHRFP